MTLAGFVFEVCRELAEGPSGNACISDGLEQGAEIQEPCSMAGEEAVWWEAGLGLELFWESQLEAQGDLASRDI